MSASKGHSAFVPLLAVLMLLVLTLIACPSAGPTVPPTPTPGASLASVRAEVLLREGATDTLVPVGETRPLAVGQAIDVDENGRAQLRFLNFLLVEVFRDTDLQLESMAAPDAPPAYKFKLQAGTLYAEVDPATEVVSIESDLAVITSLGTRFWVYVDPGEITWVVCKEREVEITAQGRTVTVAADQQSWALPGQPPQEPVEASRNEVGDLVPLLDELTGGDVQDKQVLQTVGMVYVPAGEFIMGSKEDDPEADDEEHPQHTVYLSAFWIDRTEVTNEQYDRCVAAGVCETPMTFTFDSFTFDGAAEPVVGVSWDDAQAYCQWAGKQLPTEAQWEKAARGTDGRKYPWGDTFDGTKLNYSGTDDSHVYTSPVGSYPAGASPYGALDMAGNVWEWCQDWYDADYYAVSPRRDPQGPDSGSDRVVRGGSWVGDERDVRAANRDRAAPGYRVDEFGFRCVYLAP